jgi:hypothetical protein
MAIFPSLAGVIPPDGRYIHSPTDRRERQHLPVTGSDPGFDFRSVDAVAMGANCDTMASRVETYARSSRCHRRGLETPGSRLRAVESVRRLSSARPRSSGRACGVACPDSPRPIGRSNIFRRRQSAARHSAGRHDGPGRRLETETCQSNERPGEGDRATVECPAPRSREVPSKNQNQRLTTRSRDRRINLRRHRAAVRKLAMHVLRTFPAAWRLK